MPGLSACFSCGMALGEDPPAPAPSVPRVRAVNPLARPGRPAPPFAEPRRRWRVLLGVLRGHLPALLAALAGALSPGLTAWRAGERRAAAALGGAALLALALVALSWTSITYSTALFLLGAALLAGAADAARRRSALPEPWDRLAGLGYGLAALSLLALLADLSLDAWRPRVQVRGGDRLPAGTYLLAPLEAPPEINTLVIAAASGRQVIAPVLAVAGQEVSRTRDALLVDGRPTPVQPMQRDARLPPLEAPLAVPPGYVALYAEPIELWPVEELAGYLSYQWAPAEQRGPVSWPPEP